MRTAPPQKRPGEEAVPAADQQPPDERRYEQRDKHEREEKPGDHADARVLQQVLRVARLVGAARLEKSQPVCACQRPAECVGDAVAVVRVRAVRVAVPIGELVVLAVVGDPGEHVALDRHLSEHRERVPHRAGGLE